MFIIYSIGYFIVYVILYYSELGQEIAYYKIDKQSILIFTSEV